jgi:hypothetical protein
MQDLDTEERNKWILQTLELLQAAWPTDISYPPSWQRYSHLLPHVTTATNHAEQCAERIIQVRDRRTGSAVVGAAKQPVQELRVAARDIDHLQAALRARHEHHITAAHAESSRHRCQRCLGGLAVNRALSHPDNQRAIMSAADARPQRTRPHPDDDPHKLTVAPRPGGWLLLMIVVAGPAWPGLARDPVPSYRLSIKSVNDREQAAILTRTLSSPSRSATRSG